VLDMAKVAQVEYADKGLPEEKNLRAALKKALEKPGSGFETVEEKDVPRANFEDLSRSHAQKQRQWFRKQARGMMEVEAAAPAVDADDAGEEQLDEELEG
jgi:hypothetical protein